MKRLNVLWLILLLGCVSLGFSQEKEEDSNAWIADRRGHVVHRAMCYSAVRIRDRQKVKFMTLKEAHLKGFSPCRVCHPAERRKRSTKNYNNRS